MFFKELGIDIDINNYKILFMPQKQFIARYGLRFNELVKLYNYNKFINKNIDSKINILKK